MANLTLFEFASVSLSELQQKNCAKATNATCGPSSEILCRLPGVCQFVGENFEDALQRLLVKIGPVARHLTVNGTRHEREGDQKWLTEQVRTLLLRTMVLAEVESLSVGLTRVWSQALSAPAGLSKCSKRSKYSAASKYSGGLLHIFDEDHEMDLPDIWAFISGRSVRLFGWLTEEQLPMWDSQRGRELLQQQLPGIAAKAASICKLYSEPEYSSAEEPGLAMLLRQSSSISPSSPRSPKSPATRLGPADSPASSAPSAELARLAI